MHFTVSREKGEQGEAFFTRWGKKKRSPTGVGPAYHHKGKVGSAPGAQYNVKYLPNTLPEKGGGGKKPLFPFPFPPWKRGGERGGGRGVEVPFPPGTLERKGETGAVRLLFFP